MRQRYTHVCWRSTTKRASICGIMYVAFCMFVCVNHCFMYAAHMRTYIIYIHSVCVCVCICMCMWFGGFFFVGWSFAVYLNRVALVRCVRLCVCVCLQAARVNLVKCCGFI